MRVKTRSEEMMFVCGSELGFTVMEQSCLPGRTGIPCQNKDLIYEAESLSPANEPYPGSILVISRLSQRVHG